MASAYSPKCDSLSSKLKLEYLTALRVLNDTKQCWEKKYLNSKLKHIVCDSSYIMIEDLIQFCVFVFQKNNSKPFLILK